MPYEYVLPDHQLSTNKRKNKLHTDTNAIRPTRPSTIQKQTKKNLHT